MNIAQLLLSIPKPSGQSATPLVKRDTTKAWAAKKEKVRQWFRDNMKDETWPTSLIASRRGQTNASCLPLLYDLEEEGFIQRAGEGTRTGRGRCPVLWKLTNPPKPSS